MNLKFKTASGSRIGRVVSNDISLEEELFPEKPKDEVTKVEASSSKTNKENETYEQRLERLDREGASVFTMQERVALFMEAEKERREAKALLARAEAAQAALQEKLLDDLEELGVTSFNRGGYTVYVHTQAWASVHYNEETGESRESEEDKKKARQRAVERLQQEGFSNFITIEHSGLSSYLRALKEESVEKFNSEMKLLEGAIDFVDRVSLRVRKA